MMAEFSLPLLLSKSFILAQMTVCPLADFVPRVEVYFKPDKPVYVTDAPAATLTKAMIGKSDVTHLGAEDSKWRVMGITEVSVGGGNFNVSYTGRADNYGNVCVYVDTVTFQLSYKPNIYIANEIMDLPCMLRVTKLHEQRHVAADHRILKEYIPKIKMEILWYLRSLGPQGPYPQHEAKQRADGIMKEVMKAIEPMIGKLAETRRKRQGDIDTVENYKYESSFCPGERVKLK